MVLESLSAGADAILLLAVCLPDPLLGELRALAGELGLAVLGGCGAGQEGKCQSERGDSASSGHR